MSVATLVSPLVVPLTPACDNTELLCADAVPVVENLSRQEAGILRNRSLVTAYVDEMMGVFKGKMFRAHVSQPALDHLLVSNDLFTEEQITLTRERYAQDPEREARPVERFIRAASSVLREFIDGDHSSNPWTVLRKIQSNHRTAKLFDTPPGTVTLPIKMTSESRLSYYRFTEAEVMGILLSGRENRVQLYLCEQLITDDLRFNLPSATEAHVVETIDGLDYLHLDNALLMEYFRDTLSLGGQLFAPAIVV